MTRKFLANHPSGGDARLLETKCRECLQNDQRQDRIPLFLLKRAIITTNSQMRAQPLLWAAIRKPPIFFLPVNCDSLLPITYSDIPTMGENQFPVNSTLVLPFDKSFSLAPGHGGVLSNRKCMPRGFHPTGSGGSWELLQLGRGSLSRGWPVCFASTTLQRGTPTDTYQQVYVRDKWDSSHPLKCQGSRDTHQGAPLGSP